MTCLHAAEHQTENEGATGQLSRLLVGQLMVLVFLEKHFLRLSAAVLANRKLILR